MTRSLLMFLLLLPIGCTEAVHITTSPPGGRVFVNNREAGIAPFDFEAPSKDLPSTRYDYRIELAGYRPAEGTLPVRVSVGRVIGSVLTLGILYGVRGVHVFEEDLFQQGLYPLESTAGAKDALLSRPIELRSPPSGATPPITDAIDGVPLGMPHPRKVFITTAPLDALPEHSYVFLKDLEVESEWYGTGNGILEELAREARRVGADAVFGADHSWSPGWWAWARPVAGGKAIALRNPCATRGISGDIRPTDEADTPKNRAASERCEDSRSTDPTGSPPSRTDKCTVDQVLAMKAAGLSNEQVKAACER